MGVARTGAVLLEDVARAAGVSRATASRVVRGDARVSPQKVRAVQRAVKELNYRPNRAARSLVTRRTDTIALIVPEPDQRIFSDPFFSSVVQAVVSSLDDTDVQLVLAFADKEGHHQRLRPFLYDGHVDGAIVTSHHQIPGQVETFMHAPIPIVFIGRPEQSTSFESWVDVDNKQAGRMAARRLVEGGSRKPAIITGSTDMVAAQDRLDGFCDELRTHDIEALVVNGSFTAESGARAGYQLIEPIQRGEVDAVFSSSDLMTMAAINVWRDQDIRIPDDVCVVSIDNSEMGASFTPPLTSLTNPADQMADVATRMLRDLINGEHTEAPVLLPCELVVRASG